MLSEVYSSVKPLFILSSLSGLFFIKVDFKDEKVLKPSWSTLTVFAVIMIHTIGYWQYSNLELITRIFETKASSKGSPILMFLDYSVVVTSMSWIYYKRDKILKILIMLSEIDEKFEVRINYKLQQKRLWIILGSMLLIIVIILLIQLSLTVFSQTVSIHKEYLIPLFHILLFITKICLFSHYIVFMSKISKRFVMMNDCIDKSIDQLPGIHLKIAECVKLYNSVYGTPMMGTFAVYLVWCSIYSSIPLLMTGLNLLMKIMIIIGMAIAAIILCSIIHAAERISIAKQHGMQQLYSKLAFEPENSDKICQIIMQIRDTNVGFSCKFFDFNWNLMFKFITACVMYLIIIIQFEGENLKKDQLIC
ncbi:hypothetical protein ACKWTF_016176 [Chironomus riparius]